MMITRHFFRILAVLLIAAVVLGAGFGGRSWWTWNQFRQAQSALEHYDAEKAQRYLQPCLTRWPDRLEVRLLAARAARQVGELEQAEQHLHRCQQLQAGRSPEVTLEASLLRAQQGQLDDVEEFLEVRRDSNPQQAAIINEALVQGYLRMYRIRDALSCLEGWLQRQPNQEQALFLRGETWRKVRSLEKAVADYQQVLAINLHRDDARRWLTSCLLELGRLDEAGKHLPAVLKRWPNDPDVCILVGRCQSKRGQFAEAQDTLDSVLADHPDYGPALRARGHLALLQEQWQEAEPWLNRALAAQPNDYEAHWALYQVLHHQGREEQARSELERSEDLKTRLERLAEIGNRQMSQRPHDPALHCELGQLLLSLGYTDLGRNWLLSALHQDPEYAPAKTALARIQE
jgi:tetratricopeptide (TPR) repeat protein